MDEYTRKLEEENRMLREELRTDRLTGIPNERALEEFVAARRCSGYYIFSDMDGMGLLNKHPDFGHDRVNDYIREFGEWLRKNVRSENLSIASRKHGDEFLVWCSNKKGALRIRNSIRSWQSKDGRVTVSAGMGRDVQTADCNMSRFKEERKVA